MSNPNLVIFRQNGSPTPVNSKEVSVQGGRYLFVADADSANIRCTLQVKVPGADRFRNVTSKVFKDTQASEDQAFLVELGTGAYRVHFSDFTGVADGSVTAVLLPVGR